MSIWASAEAYEPYVGRWSRLVAREFLAWLGVPPQKRWLDVGCGTGALTQTILAIAVPRTVTGIDASASFLAHARAQTADTRAHFVVGDAQALPFPDEAFDTVVMTLSLCTIPDDSEAIAEASRVLKPGGRLHFLDHGLAPDERVRRWQRRLDPVQQRLIGGCHFTRAIADLEERAGFEITELDVFYEEGTPKVAGATSRGVARSP